LHHISVTFTGKAVDIKIEGMVTAQIDAIVVMMSILQKTVEAIKDTSTKQLFEAGCILTHWKNSFKWLWEIILYLIVIIYGDCCL